jgi:FtsP/CotA-like multicopper oxidase with cupredoxin domain
MRPVSVVALLGILLTSGATVAPATLPVVQPNSNTARAGIVRDGVLEVTLDATEAAWRINGATRAPMTIDAFSEPGKPPLMPGPLVRTVRGTPIRFSVHNSLPLPLTFFVPAAIHGGPDRLDAMDSVVIAPAAVGTLSIVTVTPGNYIYRATTPPMVAKFARMAGLLAGAIVVDSPRSTAKPNDRVLVIMETPDSMFAAHVSPTGRAPADGIGRLIYTINGRSWPETERIAATVGDTLYWRVLNASHDVHPMHLHGFYYRVDTLTGPVVAPDQEPPGRFVVTELMLPLASMSMTWSPDRPGNWLFHCHFSLHTTPDSVSAAANDPHHRDMSGLVVGVVVAPRPGDRPLARAVTGRRIRMIAIADTTPADKQFPNALPTMHYVIEEKGRRVEGGPGFSPELDLTRGVPVSITIVNHLDEPTSIHWHGVEVQDSYVDGVPGFSGAGTHLEPEIAPADSFVAHFTPPRSGTFMYHAHVDEMREQRAGLLGALIVRDPGAAPSPDDHVFFLKGSRRGDLANPLEINGEPNPDTVVLRVGRPTRLRILNLAWINPGPIVSLTERSDSSLTLLRDSSLVLWTPVAKDGRDLPAAARMPHLARQIVSIGETYDFELTPTRRGTLRFEVRENAPIHRGMLLTRVPIRVE